MRNVEQVGPHTADPSTSAVPKTKLPMMKISNKYEKDGVTAGFFS